MSTTTNFIKELSKMTKAQLTEVLNTNFKAVQKKDKSVAESIQYTAKTYKADSKKVTKKDLLDLAKQVFSVLGDSFVVPTPAPVENSVKSKKLQKKTKETENTVENEEDVESEETEETPKKKSKSSNGKKPVTLKKSMKDVTTLFADDFETEDGKFKLAKVENFEDLRKYDKDGVTLVFALYMPVKFMKEYGYFGGLVEVPNAKFENDLDLTTLLYVSDNDITAYTLSMFTEAAFVFTPDMLEEVEGVRYSQGIPYQIYEFTSNEE